MRFGQWRRPEISRTPKGNYILHERNGKKELENRVALPPRVARLIQKAQALENYIPDVLQHPGDDPDYAPELKLYHRFNCHKTVLTLLGRLSLKEARDLEGSGEDEVLAISDKPFASYPYFTREEVMKAYSVMSPKEVDEFLASTSADWRGETVEEQVYDYVNFQVSEANGPCVVQVGTGTDYGYFHLQHSFIALKTKGGELIAFGKEGFTDPSLSRSYGNDERSDEEYAEAKFQLGRISEVWKHHSQYVGSHSQWRVIPLSEISPAVHPGFKEF